MDKINVGAFIILISVFLSALLIGGTFFYGIFIFVFFLLIFSYYTGIKAYKSLECIIWKVSEKVTTGTAIDYNVEIYNSSMFPIPYLEVYIKLPKRLTGETEKLTVRALAPGGKTKLTRHLVCQHKGIYDLGIVEVIYCDPFFIFGWKKQFNHNITLTVYPRVYPIENIDIPANQLFGTLSKTNTAFEDFTSIKDIRKYQYGDSFKKIHWKVSAHKGELHVKNLDMNASTHMHLFLDLFEGNYKNDGWEDIEEKAAEWTASLINYSMSKGIGINFYAMGQEYINLSDKEAGNFEIYMDVLSSLHPQGTISVSQLICKEAQKLNSGVTIIVITPKVDSDLIEMATQLRYKGFEVIIFEINDNISNFSIHIDEVLGKIVRDRYA